MSTASAPVSDMFVTVKSREVQRALLAEMRGDREAARRHSLAGAHLEVVLAADYEQAGEGELALRSQLSAASCFWRGGSKGRRKDSSTNCERPIPTKPRRFNRFKPNWPAIILLWPPDVGLAFFHIKEMTPPRLFGDSRGGG